MKRVVLCALALAVLVTMPSVTNSADLAVSGSADLVISTAVAGSNPPAATDQTCQLQWTKQAPDPTKKITVQTSLAGPRFALAVEAVNIDPSGSGYGTSAGEVAVSTGAADFIVNISLPVVIAGCDLLYEATAQATDGTGIDTHTITYTIVDQ